MKFNNVKKMFSISKRFRLISSLGQSVELVLILAKPHILIHDICVEIWVVQNIKVLIL